MRQKYNDDTEAQWVQVRDVANLRIDEGPTADSDHDPSSLTL